MVKRPMDGNVYGSTSTDNKTLTFVTYGLTSLVRCVQTEKWQLCVVLASSRLRDSGERNFRNGLGKNRESPVLSLVLSQFFPTSAPHFKNSLQARSLEQASVVLHDL